MLHTQETSDSKGGHKFKLVGLTVSSQPSNMDNVAFFQMDEAGTAPESRWGEASAPALQL